MPARGAGLLSSRVQYGGDTSNLLEKIADGAGKEFDAAI
jgi:hypothetical protein